MPFERDISDEDLDTHTVAGLVAYNLRRLRRKTGWSVRECCDETGIAVPVWYRIEAGTQERGNFAALDEIADFFEVHPSELFRKPRK